jgi:probable addiction module antidote protein
MKLRKFEDYLHEKLRDPEYAAIYVQVALEDDGIEEFLHALREVAIAQGGVQKLAEESQYGRESLYKSLSKQGNPRIKTVNDILHTLGMQMTITPTQTVPNALPEQPPVPVPA